MKDWWVFSGCVERRCDGVVPPRLLQRMLASLWGPLDGRGRLGRLHPSFLAVWGSRIQIVVAVVAERRLLGAKGEVV